MSDRVPEIITSAGELLAHYDVLFCDVWGVVHDGRSAYAEGCRALQRFRERGGTVVLVSNAPRTARVVREILDQKGVPHGISDAIVPSGDLARAYAKDRGMSQVHHIGPDRDLDVFDQSGLNLVALHAADAIFCTGLIRDREETAEHYRRLLSQALDRQLTLICANPDLVVDVGGTLLPCAGAIAQLYEDMGGQVHWAGKPFATAYETARKVAEDLRGEAVASSRVLAIGDAVRTDIAGAVAFGIDALFVGQGVHRDVVMADGALQGDAVAQIFTGEPKAIAAIDSLRW